MIAGNKKLIVKLEGDALTVYEVEGKGKVIEKKKNKWDPDDLEEVEEFLRPFIEKRKYNKVRVLLGEDTCYIVEIDHQDHLTRKTVEKEIHSRVPELLSEPMWDYVVGEENKIVAFTPVKEPFEALKSVLTKIDVDIETIGAEELPNRNNEDPIAVLATKKIGKTSKNEELRRIKKDTKKKGKASLLGKIWQKLHNIV